MDQGEQIKFVSNIPKRPPPEEPTALLSTHPYPHLNNYLGSLAGYILQGKNDYMQEFVNYLNFLLPQQGLGNKIVNGLQTAREKFKQRFADPSILWLSEVSFVPSNRQIEIISRLLDDKKITKLARINGYQTPELFIRGIILGEKKAIITLDKKEVTVDQIINTGGKLIFGLEKLPDDKSVNTVLATDEKKLSALILYAINYYYYDFSGTEKNVHNFQKTIALASARVDLLGFKPRDNDKEAKLLIDQIPDLFKHQMLNIVNLGYKKIDLARRLISFIEQGKVSLIFGEIKSQFNSLVKSDNNSYKPVVFDQKSIREDQYQDIAHSLLSMFEFLTRISNLPGKEIPHHESLIKLMNPDINVRRQALFSLRPLIRSLVKSSENSYYLIKVFWPIINPQLPDSIRRFNLKTIDETQPQLAVVPVNRHRMAKEILFRANAMFTDV